MANTKSDLSKNKMPTSKRSRKIIVQGQQLFSPAHPVLIQPFRDNLPLLPPPLHT